MFKIGDQVRIRETTLDTKELEWSNRMNKFHGVIDHISGKVDTFFDNNNWYYLKNISNQNSEVFIFDESWLELVENDINIEEKEIENLFK